MMLYLMWSETDKRVDVTQRIVRGSEAYKDKFGVMPRVCVVSAADARLDGQEIGGVTVRKCGVMVVAENVYYLGME